MKQFNYIKIRTRDLLTTWWATAFALNAILVFPSWFHKLAETGTVFGFWYTRQIFSLFWISVDLLAMLTLLYATRNKSWHRWVRRACITAYILLLAFEGYASVIQQLFQRPPVLYNELYLITDALYLVLDNGPVAWLILLIITALVAILILWIIPKMFGHLSRRLRETGSPEPILWTLGILWTAVLLVQIDWGIHKRDAAAQLVSYRAGQSVETSLEYYHTIRKTDWAALDSTFQEYANLQLSTRPNIYLIMLESYGKILLQHPKLQDGYNRIIRDFSDTLESRGWHAVTNYSDAPVVGGGSWLSSATILTGIRVANEPLYHSILKFDTSHLIRVLEELGYTTISVKPADRTRPGIPLENQFGFEIPVAYKDLHYTGTAFGWGIVPDQYSLNYAYHNYVAPETGPTMLHFTTLATHMPWSEQARPPLKADWRSLNNPNDSTAWNEDFFSHLRIRLHSLTMQPLNTDYFLKLLRYDFRVIQRFMRDKIAGDAVVLIVGDHQPAMVTRKSDGTQTIVHVLSKNKQLLSTFTKEGFAQGFQKPAEDSGTIAHQDLYPMLMESLKATYGSADTSEAARIQ
ncbi:MAG: hypothetical protein K9N46_08255 [Candidatus Marinimicrobia bacterium]|nr:hypothetical protein [Candidatus Neomarinimicrobiota bacterium]MCF7828799.1 hypothetical protein [Candidatus Neomarinimicrobiota bacterium]MCF7880716.1 hypothetical protein [Candidatus Neomarinimicrobiota bacterium]